MLRTYMRRKTILTLHELSDYNFLPESLLVGIIEWVEAGDAFFK